MALPNARDHYLKTQVETASKEQLVVMLFDGIVRFTEQARKSIEDNKIEESHHALMRAQAIVMELICTIDKEQGGEVAKNLMGLHAYAFNCLIVCNMKKDVSKIDEVQRIYRQLRDGWTGAMDTLGITATQSSSTAQAVKPVTPVPPTKPTGPAPIAKSAPIAAAAPQHPAKATGAAPAQGGIQTQALAAQPAPATPAPAKPLSAQPATGYGMGRTMMMNGYGKAPAPAASAQPAAAAPAPVPVANLAPTAAPAAKPIVNAKQAAMLSAYQAGARSIA